MKEILLKTENLSKSFSNGGAMQHVLKNIDLQLFRGDFTVIMGASGAGKSTLLYALSGMDTPTLGTITFGEKVISDLSPDGLAVFRREHCGFVFQQIYLIDSMSIMDNVLAAGLLVNRNKKALVEQARALFKAVDLPRETQEKFPAQISGGEAQRVGIVRALINSPQILFADEPTGNLDSHTSKEVMELMQKVVREQNRTLVMVTHDNELAAYADRVFHIIDGEIVKIEENRTCREDKRNEKV